MSYDFSGARAFYQQGDKHFKEAVASIDHCWSCGDLFDENNKPVDSHSIPQRSLRLVAESQGNNKGKTFSVLGGFALATKNPEDRVSIMGIRNAGVFQSICGKCENSLFTTYENSNLEIVTPQESYEIALKITLRSLWLLMRSYLKKQGISNHVWEERAKLAQEMESIIGIPSLHMLQMMQEAEKGDKDQDLFAFYQQFSSLKHTLELLKNKNGVRVVCNATLPSPVPLTGQALTPMAVKFPNEEGPFIFPYFVYFTPDAADSSAIRFVVVTFDLTPKFFDKRILGFTVGQHLFFAACGEGQLFFHPSISGELKSLLVDLGTEKFSGSTNTEYGPPMVNGAPVISYKDYALTNEELAFMERKLIPDHA